MNNPVETIEHRIEHAIESLEAVLPPPRSPWRKALGVLGWMLVAVYFIFATAFLSLRYWVLPHISDYAQDIAATLSASVGERVTIGKIDAGWQGLRPYLEIANLRVHDRQDAVVLALPGVNATVSWWSLPTASLRFHSLEFVAPSLVVRRDAEGQIFVAGLEMKQKSGDAGFPDWVLAQNEVNIRGARVSWLDEQRKAPQLDLADVNLRISNRGTHHRFALQADPPDELASALDVRGDFTGDTVSQLQQWNGQVYTEFEYTDLAEWQRWINFPFEIQRGKGGLRLWLVLASGKPTELVADVAMSKLAARFTPDLPLLELETLQGRIGARSGKEDLQVFGERIAMKSVAGPALAPADFSITRHAAGGNPGGGNLQANGLELEPLAWLADYLPVPAEMRKALADAAPRGSVHELKLDWVGALPVPEKFNARGRFSRLGMKAYAGVPAFSGLSGNVDGNERTGSVSLNSERAILELAGILNEPRLELDTLTGQVGWSRLRDGQMEVRVSNVSVANKDAAGSLFGSWQSAQEGAGTVDITARLTRADGSATPRYLPAFIGPVTVNWLKRALVSARSNDMRFRIKGELREFPWDDGKKGQFQISAKIHDGTLDYAENWPRITGIGADLLLEGKRLSLTSPRATVFGAKLSGIRVAIPDLVHHDEVLTVEGNADGPTGEFFKFIDASPVAGMIDHFTEEAGAQGNGRLQLRLELPLRRLADLKVAGNYQFANNQLLLDPDLPPLTQVNGRLDFTNTGVSVRAITAQLLGGPITVAAATREGTLSVNAQGTFNAAGIRRAADSPVTRSMQGAAPYRATINIRKRVADLVVTSDLQGLALDLPPPFGKAAADAMPLRIERTNLNEQEAARRGIRARAEVRGGVRSETRGETLGDAINVTLGKVASVQLLRRKEGDEYRIVRGGIGLNEPASVPDRFGVQVSGSLRSVDVDRWRSLLPAAPAAPANPALANTAANTAAEDPSLLFNAANLRINTLDAGGKRFNEVSLRAARGSNQWQATVSARELSGELIWRSTGRGSLLARLKHLTIPDNRPGAGTDPSPAATELPAIDLIADNFLTRDKKLGRLELQAVNEAGDWRIEKMLLSAPEGTISADGVWKSAGAGSTSLNVKLDVSDVGKYLDRVGSPGTVARGTAKIEGKLAWVGSPHGFDYPSLSGNLKLQAEKGQFLKVEPGIAKLIGILSLQALPKRITLDFNDVFSDGFAFDAIQSTVSINRGIASTQDFAMQGSAAAVTIKGDADLARETQNLRVRVIPALGDSVSTVAGLLLANPITGIGAMLAQRLFNNPLGQIFAYDYAVTGSWNDPKVEKLSRAAPQAAQDAPQKSQDSRK